jgi:zinc/manganese transport system substrate-binding protein
MPLRALACAAFLALPTAVWSADAPIRIVAAEAFYAEVAQAVGGDRVSVASVPISPDADPHDFSPPPSVARAVADADLVVMNGLATPDGHLVEASPDSRVVVEVAPSSVRDRWQPASLK